ncbi:transcriptional regulator [Striga asiatica]|uniref:Transcriptional regulator n=1 Tax=Striga asiatica TaxID=4170 RepID=A0A5A7QDY6_STRAF|nr:transcriptional regulator [Striga asiatica]
MGQPDYGSEKWEREMLWHIQWNTKFPNSFSFTNRPNSNKPKIAPPALLPLPSSCAAVGHSLAGPRANFSRASPPKLSVSQSPALCHFERVHRGGISDLSRPHRAFAISDDSKIYIPLVRRVYRQLARYSKTRLFSSVDKGTDHCFLIPFFGWDRIHRAIDTKNQPFQKEQANPLI